jgi:branched-chain amino acid transport system permease protein
MRPSPHLVLRYADDVRLIRSRASVVALLGLAAVYVALPVVMAGNSFWLTALNFAGIAAIAAIGLTLLTGFSGQISLGHAFFLGVGAYAEAYFGADLKWPLIVWLPVAGLVGAFAGAVTGPFALRLRGNYLVIVTFGLVFIGLHIFRNWESLTGGLSGRATAAPLALGPIDFSRLRIFGIDFDRDQGMFWLVWAVVALAYIIAKNIVRTRPGRALQAIRDRDVAAALVGIDATMYKISAFALSSAFAAVGGAIYASYTQYVSAQEWDLGISIQYIAMIVMGGITAIEGAIIGALFVGLMPQLVEKFGTVLPFLASSGAGGGMTAFVFNQIVFGALIILFLLFEPRGLWSICQRLGRMIRTWPLSP